MYVSISNAIRLLLGSSRTLYSTGFTELEGLSLKTKTLYPTKLLSWSFTRIQTCAFEGVRFSIASFSRGSASRFIYCETRVLRSAISSIVGVAVASGVRGKVGSSVVGTSVTVGWGVLVSARGVEKAEPARIGV